MLFFRINKLNMKSTYIKLILVFLVIFISCSKEQDKGIVGKWKLNQPLSYFEFSENGDLMVNDSLGITNGKYAFKNNKLDLTFLEGGTMAISHPLMKADVSIAKDSMTISFMDRGIKRNLSFVRIN